MLHHTNACQDQWQTPAEQGVAARWAATVWDAASAHGAELDIATVNARSTPSDYVEVAATSLNAARSLAMILAGSGAVGVNVQDSASERRHVFVIASTPVVVTWTVTHHWAVPYSRGGGRLGRTSASAATTQDGVL